MSDRSGHEGQRLGNYYLLRLLGQGGFARVYLGEHIELKRQAAIKVLDTKVVDQEDIEKFRIEARRRQHAFSRDGFCAKWLSCQTSSQGHTACPAYDYLVCEAGCCGFAVCA